MDHHIVINRRSQGEKKKGRSVNYSIWYLSSPSSSTTFLSPVLSFPLNPSILSLSLPSSLPASFFPPFLSHPVLSCSLMASLFKYQRLGFSQTLERKRTTSQRERESQFSFSLVVLSFSLSLLRITCLLSSLPLSLLVSLSFLSHSLSILHCFIALPHLMAIFKWIQRKTESLTKKEKPWWGGTWSSLPLSYHTIPHSNHTHIRH